MKIIRLKPPKKFNTKGPAVQGLDYETYSFPYSQDTVIRLKSKFIDDLIPLRLVRNILRDTTEESFYLDKTFIDLISQARRLESAGLKSPTIRLLTNFELDDNVEEDDEDY